MTTHSNASSYSLGRRPLSKGLNVTCWALQGLAAVAFLAAGGSKLAAAPAMVEMFAKIGAGQWFRYRPLLLSGADHAQDPCCRFLDIRRWLRCGAAPTP
jgi:hypothetical protein